ncbi:MAG: ATP-binding protein [Panacagrimonas sp.]
MRLLACGVLLWAGFAVTCLWIASSQLWLGLEFEAVPETAGLRVSKVFSGGPADGKLNPGDQITQIRSRDGASVVLTSRDLIATPNYLRLYKQQSEFMVQQQAIVDIVRSRAVRVLLSDGREIGLAVAPRRPLHAIPIPALLQFTVLPGLVILISFAVLHRWPSDYAARYLVGCALGYMCLISTGLYTERELALPVALFRVLLAIDNLGGLILLGGSAVALLWNHPVPLTRRPAAPWIYAVAITGAAVHHFRVFDNVTLGFFLWCMLSVAAQGVVAGLQWRKARGRPAHRAMLKWLLVPWLALAGMYTVLFYIPAAAGLGPQAPPIMGWVLFLLIFVGLALGMTRFRLYYVNPANLLVWFVDGVLIVALLGLGLYALDLPYFFAGCLALAATGVSHTFVRDAVWSAQALQHADFGRVLKMVLETLSQCRSSSEVRASWSRTLEHLFEPRAITSAEALIDQVEILDDGERMRIPAPSAGGALLLEMPFRGRGLFMPRDARVVKDLYKIFDAVVRYWDSHRDGESGERLRLSRALDAGLDRSLANLAEIAPTAESKQFAENARLELQRISRSLAEPPRPLTEVLATLREETEERCTAAGIRPAWREHSIPLSIELSGQIAFDLQSIVREAVTNAIRHGGGANLQVEMAWAESDGLGITIEDDGVGSPDTVVRGLGMGNIQRRAESRGGKLQINASDLGGLRLSILLPLA